MMIKAPMQSASMAHESWIRRKVERGIQGVIAWGYLKMSRITGEARYRERALRCFEWLMQNRSAGYKDFCWGNHFSFSTRAGKIPEGEPTIVWSSLIGQAFADA